MQEIIGIRVLGKLARHRADHGEFICDPADVRKQVADGDSALPVGLELPGARQHLAYVVELRGVDLKQAAGILAGVPLEPGLGIEGVDLRHAPVHVEEDHA